MKRLKGLNNVIMKTLETNQEHVIFHSLSLVTIILNEFRSMGQ